MVSPNRLTRSVASTRPLRCSQCGSDQLRLHSSPPSRSSQSGSMAATVRANSWVVSTNSLATAHCGPRPYRPEPGNSTTSRPPAAR